MTCKRETIDEIEVFRLQSVEDIDKIEDFDKAVENAIIENKHKFVFNLKNTRFINSSGIGTMIDLFKRESEKEKLKLCYASEEVKRMIKLLTIEHIFDIFNTEEEAIKSFQ